jgi:hypothetical protein
MTHDTQFGSGLNLEIGSGLNLEIGSGLNLEIGSGLDVGTQTPDTPQFGRAFLGSLGFGSRLHAAFGSR